MKWRISPWYALGAAVLIAVLIGFSLSVYVVHPGQTALLLRGGKVVASDVSPGLHWKIPLVEGLVVLDAKVQLSGTQADNGGDSSSNKLSTACAVAWRIVEPNRFYTATGGDSEVAATKLLGAITPALQKAVAGRSAKAFLQLPADSIETALNTAVTPVAKSLGVQVVGVYLGTGQMPGDLAQKIGQHMAEATQAEIGTVTAAGQAKSAAIKNRADMTSAAVIATANRQAARIRGEGEAEVAGIYAVAAREEPEFFSFYRQLEAERRQLVSNTRVLVISVDSPWFKALNPPGKGGDGN